MARAKTVGGQDPTRTRPGGSRTETKITEASELGSDRSGDDQLQDNAQRGVRKRQSVPHRDKD